MNKLIQKLITPRAGQYLEDLQDMLLLVKEINIHSAISFPILFDLPTVKNIANTVFTLSTQDINKQMKLGGWEKLIGGSDLNEELHSLSRNPAIILYTQILIGLVVALISTEEWTCKCNYNNRGGICTHCGELKASEEQRELESPQ